MAKKRYYYKSKEGRGFLNLKSPLAGAELDKYDEITQEEFDALTYVAPHVPTAQEIARDEKVARINFLKGELRRTDYVALKLAEGETTKNGEYKTIFANRKAWREEINELEEELTQGEQLGQEEVPPKQGDVEPELVEPEQEPGEEVVEGKGE